MPLVSANVFPVPRVDVRDRDFFKALRDGTGPDLFVSKVYIGKFDGQLFFSVAERRGATLDDKVDGNGAADDGEARRPNAPFRGVVLVSLRPGELATGLRQLIGEPEDVIALVRTDGEILARSIGFEHPLPPLPADSPMRPVMAAGAERAVVHGVSTVDGMERIAAFRRVGGWPIYVSAARSRAAVVARWWQVVAWQAGFSVPAALALVGLALFAFRRSRDAAEARAALHVEAERRVAAEVLHESEARLREIVATLDLGAFMASDADGIIRLWSAGCERLYGWTAAEAVGSICHTLLGTLFPIPLTEIEVELERAGEWSGELRQRRRDGTEVIVATRKALRRNVEGRPASVVEAVVDVTAERQAKAALAESDARLRAATEGAGLGIVEFDFARGSVWCDPRAAIVVGGALPAGVWMPLDGVDYANFVARVHLDDRLHQDAGLRAFADGMVDSVSLEFRVRRADDNWALIWVHGTALDRSPVSGRPRRLIGVVQDVTERHRLESELRQAQKLQALGELAGGVAHDFNNVLQMVEGGATLIERHGTDPAIVRRYARMMMEAADRGASVTRRLLAFARRGELRASAVDPVGLLRGLRELLASTLGARIVVHVEAEAGLPPLLADKGQLETALVNLATNARDAMPEGGMLTFSAIEERVAEDTGARGSAGVLTPGRYIRLSVRDTGIGMDAATLARVTEPFFTTKPADKGTGLGLSVVKGFAEQSGGAFAIESEPWCGTTVTLWLPQAESEAAVVAPVAGDVAGPSAGQGGMSRVLVVDDEPTVRETLMGLLEASGYAVLGAANGAEALARLDAGEMIDVMVTDLTMPGMDGLSLIREARVHHPDLPAVLLTGYVDDGEALAAGGVEGAPFCVLRKPISGSQLADRIAALLEITAVA